MVGTSIDPYPSPLITMMPPGHCSCIDISVAPFRPWFPGIDDISTRPRMDFSCSAWCILEYFGFGWKMNIHTWLLEFGGVCESLASPRNPRKQAGEAGCELGVSVRITTISRCTSQIAIETIDRPKIRPCPALGFNKSKWVCLKMGYTCCDHFNGKK